MERLALASQAEMPMNFSPIPEKLGFGQGGARGLGWDGKSMKIGISGKSLGSGRANNSADWKKLGDDAI